MKVDTIPKLDELLSEVLPKCKKIERQEVERLTAAGENYGSLVLKVEVELKSENDSAPNEILNIVAKLPPPNDYLQDVFKTTITFKNEIQFYKTIVPIMQDYQRKHGIKNVIECFPKYYGSRLSLDPTSEKVDNDAALLLENLTIDYFECVSRLKGFNEDETKLILKNFASFQAIPLAIKLNDSELFKSKFLPILPEFQIFHDDDEAKDLTKKQLVEIFSENKNLPVLLDLFEKYCINCKARVRNSDMDGLYRSIIHNDLWVNNIMLKFKESQVVDCKFLDFQIYEFGPLAMDVLFFLFTSVKLPILVQKFEEFLKYYHDELVENLKQLNCDVSHFSFDEFKKEITKVLKDGELYHILFMLHIIAAPKGSGLGVDEIKREDMKKEKPISQNQRDRAEVVVGVLFKGGWLEA